MKKIRQTLKEHVLVMTVWIQLKFGIGGALLRGSCYSKTGNFCSGTIELRMCLFLALVKYTLVCCASALAVLGRTTHYHVS